ncbi:hypothetical protein BH09PSE1_BH09PSE1_07300 [soil metagenome]
MPTSTRPSVAASAKPLVDGSRYQVSTPELIVWLKDKREPLVTMDEAHLGMLTYHPRTAFIKTVPRDGVCFDVGAGTGSMEGLRRWLGYLRPDLAFVGAALEDPSPEARYDEFWVGNFDSDFPEFERRPNAAILVHVIEHLENPTDVLSKVAGCLAPDSRIYIEWPSFHSAELPRLRDIVAAGFHPQTINFFDDSTHITPISHEQVVEMVHGAGLAVEGMGFVDMPFIADALRDLADSDDAYILTMAVWLRTGFSSWVTAVKA